MANNKNILNSLPLVTIISEIHEFISASVIIFIYSYHFVAQVDLFFNF